MLRLQEKICFPPYQFKPRTHSTPFFKKNSNQRELSLKSQLCDKEQIGEDTFNIRLKLVDSVYFPPISIAPWQGAAHKPQLVQTASESPAFKYTHPMIPVLSFLNKGIKVLGIIKNKYAMSLWIVFFSFLLAGSCCVSGIILYPKRWHSGAIKP